MTTQKAQSKIKSSTIAITILSVLLAVAVAATVVLAAFSASKTATTTISFANGITLTITKEEGAGTLSNGAAADNSFTLTATNLLAAGEVISAVTATANQSAFIAYSIAPSASGTDINGETFALGQVNASGTTLTYDINAGSTKVATLTITLGTGTAYADGVVANSAAAESIVMYDSVSIATEAGKTANDLGGLTITGITTKVAAVPAAEGADAAKAALTA
ncbi:MAG: hypothetical protein IJ301_02265 [Clostridia bacterium]|nr:hypothetical protein [Clostridia bacterium]